MAEKAIVFTPDEGVRPASSAAQRRHDVDWLRTLALGLLIIYHVVISFQPWASDIFFPQNSESLEWLWIVMAIINVWRIPLLFLISGMGVRFAMERRSWRQLLRERATRILLPFVFGVFFIVPIGLAAVLAFYGYPVTYLPDPAHLWFLPFIFAYVLLLFPLLYALKQRPDNPLLRLLRAMCRRPALLLLLAIPLVLEAVITNPVEFVAYAMTPHGFLLGLVCFFIGFLFISIQDAFWPAVAAICWPAFFLALMLYLIRLGAFWLVGTPNWLIAIESMCWMLAIVGIGSQVLNKPSRALSYWSPAVYPVYIVHMPIQFVVAYFLLPTSLPAIVKLALLLLSTVGFSWLLYELLLKRVRWLRPIVGLKRR